MEKHWKLDYCSSLCSVPHTHAHMPVVFLRVLFCFPFFWPAGCRLWANWTEHQRNCLYPIRPFVYPACFGLKNKSVSWACMFSPLKCLFCFFISAEDRLLFWQLLLSLVLFLLTVKMIANLEIFPSKAYCDVMSWLSIGVCLFNTAALVSPCVLWSDAVVSGQHTPLVRLYISHSKQ